MKTSCKNNYNNQKKKKNKPTHKFQSCNFAISYVNFRNLLKKFLYLVFLKCSNYKFRNSNKLTPKNLFKITKLEI